MDKITMKKNGYPSPNMADALSLTFLRPDGIRIPDNGSSPTGSRIDKFAPVG